eukprot:3763725-Prymnesium_polylepis.1
MACTICACAANETSGQVDPVQELAGARGRECMRMLPPGVQADEWRLPEGAVCLPWLKGCACR